MLSSLYLLAPWHFGISVSRHLGSKLSIELTSKKKRIPIEALLLVLGTLQTSCTELSYKISSVSLIYMVVELEDGRFAPQNQEKGKPTVRIVQGWGHFCIWR